jgi:hypothetical protein
MQHHPPLLRELLHRLAEPGYLLRARAAETQREGGVSPQPDPRQEVKEVRGRGARLGLVAQHAVGIRGEPQGLRANLTYGGSGDRDDLTGSAVRGPG